MDATAHGHGWTGGVGAAGPPRPRGLALAGWGFLVCAAVAVGYGLWGLYGSGQRVTTLDAMAADGSDVVLGPVHLQPGMNPVRAVLRVGYAPVGSTRTRYRVELVDPAGRSAWTREGAVGNRDDDASIVWTTTSLMTFEVATAGDHVLRTRFEGGTMDDLRGASLEIRRNVVRVDPRIVWGFGLAALALLVTCIVLERNRPWLHQAGEDSPRAAA